MHSFAAAKFAVENHNNLNRQTLTLESSMIQTVKKRDGRIVGYNEEKIKAAIRKAMLQTEKGEDESLIHRISDRIGAQGKEQMSVEDIQDMVELELIKSPRKEASGHDDEVCQRNHQAFR